MSGKIRVMVVDDSVVFRKILTDVLTAAKDIEVVARAFDGAMALEKLPSVAPDVVVLDVEMPKMNGLQALEAIGKRFPEVAVIMFSSHTTEAAKMTVDALSLGAKGFVAKPRGGTTEENLKVIESELLPLIREVMRGRRTGSQRMPTMKLPSARPGGDILHVTREVVAIAISTGGPKALDALIPALPQDLRVPVLVVQHMPPTFTRQLAERLNARSKLAVVEGEHRMNIVPGTVYIAPGGYHMIAVRNATQTPMIELNQDPPENACRPAADVLFRSVAKVWGRRAIGVVMTGMGSDGMLGADIMRREGAAILAQDQATSVVWGMPGAVVQKGIADLVLPLAGIGDKIVELLRHRGA